MGELTLGVDPVRKAVVQQPAEGATLSVQGSAEGGCCATARGEAEDVALG